MHSQTTDGFHPRTWGRYARMSRPWYVFLEGYLLPCITFYCVKYFLTDEADLRCVVRGLFWIGAFLVVTSIMSPSSARLPKGRCGWGVTPLGM